MNCIKKIDQMRNSCKNRKLCDTIQEVFQKKRMGKVRSGAAECEWPRYVRFRKGIEYESN